MDSPEELSTVLSLCTGYGGIERGLELAGFEHRVVAHVEIEAFAIANLAAKMEAGQLDAAPIWSNVKTLPVDCFRDRVYLLTGGYPCQPFSAAGKRKGKDDPRHLWPYIYDIIRAIRPVQCFFENVEGHISLGLREVIEDLEGLNFKTAWGIFSASEVGAPHQRKRVFILANRISGGCGAKGECGGVAKVQGKRSNDSSEAAEPSTRRTEKLAYSNGAGFKTLRDESESKRQTSPVSESSELANPINEGSQGGLQGRQDSQWEGEHGRTGCRSSAHRQPSSEICDVELNLGRGFDGVASWLDGSWELGIPRVTSDQKNRVDRLRLLGNGVVPQTAARAWTVLNKQIKEEE